MPCHTAMNAKPLILNEEDSVETVLTHIKKEKTDIAILVDDQGLYAGLFTLAGLFETLLPVQVPLSGGGTTNLDAAPGIAKRLLKIKPLPVRQFALRRAGCVYPQTPLWEGLRGFLNQSAVPLVVLDEKTKKPLGLMTQQSILQELERMSDA